VSKDKIVNVSDYNLRISSRDIKNKNFFDDTSKSSIGYIIEESGKIKNNDTIYLYVFSKGSNTSQRARQMHGFKYESDIKRLNGLKKLGYSEKWDAFGGLDKRFFSDREEKGKIIQFYNGVDYEDISWEDLDSDYKKEYFWNIKCMASGTSIEMGDLLRISGWFINNNKLCKSVDKVNNFIFNVSFHSGGYDKNILEEYLILIPISKWSQYLPNIGHNINEFSKMYVDLKEHKLFGDRTLQSEESWFSFIKRYRELSSDSLIKLRFKRDSKGQLRIQSAISNKAFKESILSNKHIRVV
jgi:hypothetical protein